MLHIEIVCILSLQLSLTADLIAEEIFKLIARKDNEPKKKKVKRLVTLRLHGTLKGLGHSILANSVYFGWLRALNFKLAEQQTFIGKSRPHNK